MKLFMMILKVYVTGIITQGKNGRSCRILFLRMSFKSIFLKVNIWDWIINNKIK